MGGISVDAQSEEQEGDRREGFYACKGVPWVAETEPEDWPDQWPSEVTDFYDPTQCCLFTQSEPSQLLGRQYSSQGIGKVEIRRIPSTAIFRSY